MTTINYQASPTGSKFHASNAVCRGFKGPVGNGKSVACIMEILRLAQDQWPNCDGVRKTRWAIVRNTTPELRTTTLNTYKQWIPESISPVTLHPIISTKINQPMPDGTKIESEIIFLAIDREEDVKKFGSLEVTGIFMNESRELVFKLVKTARERIGRYPSVIDGYRDVYDDNGVLTYDAPKERDDNGDLVLDDSGEFQYKPCKRKALLMDTNPPDDEHWWYQLAEEGCLRASEDKALAIKQTKKIFEFFDGPSPLIKEDGGTYAPNPKAENIKHLPGGFQYYLDMIAGNTEDHINVQVLGNYGMIRSGKPVYPQFNDQVHVSSDHFLPIDGLPIGIGWDFGLTPSCIFAQLTPTGQLRVVAELVSDEMSVREFARDVVKPYMQHNFSGFEIAFSMADPAGNNRGEGEGKTSIGILNDDDISHEEDYLHMGFITEPAPTNDPGKRVDAVARFLTKLVGSGVPGFLLAKRCKRLRKGFMGGYCYDKVSRQGGAVEYKEKPNKGIYSHPHDALQYLALGFVGGYVIDASRNDVYNEDIYTESNSLGY